MIQCLIPCTLALCGEVQLHLQPSPLLSLHDPFLGSTPNFVAGEVDIEVDIGKFGWDCREYFEFAPLPSTVSDSTPLFQGDRSGRGGSNEVESGWSEAGRVDVLVAKRVLG